jgi:hypothetical protein
MFVGEVGDISGVPDDRIEPEREGAASLLEIDIHDEG